MEIDVVTPTYNRPDALLGQADRLASQLLPGDRWLICDDASDYGRCPDVHAIVEKLGDASRLLFVALSYVKTAATRGTVNRARHLLASVARTNAWVIELDDHDWLEPGALNHVREAIARGAVFVYGDVQWYGPFGEAGRVFRKPDYEPYQLRDVGNPCGEGLRAYPAWLYRAVGGYRFDGPIGVGGNEYPAGDYGLHLRMELFAEGQAFYRVPAVLCRTCKVPGSITVTEGQAQADMAAALRAAAQAGLLTYGGGDQAPASGDTGAARPAV